MGTNSILRLRRTAGQLHAVEQVQKEIRAIDDKGRCRYLREFTDAFRSYERILTHDELLSQASSADIVLVGDYHALPASQHFVCGLLEQLAQGSRPTVLALEAVFSRHQRWFNA